MESFFQAGFDWAVHGDEPFVMPRRGKKEEQQFDDGIDVGKRVISEIGGLTKLREVLADSDRLRRKALDTHELFLRSIADLPKLEREALTRANRLEPCALCRNISVCAVTERTCSIFRGYAARGWWSEKDQRVPDRPFSAMAEERDTDLVREAG